MSEYGIRLDPIYAEQAEPKMTAELSHISEQIQPKLPFDSGENWKNQLALKQLKRLLGK